MRTVRHRVPRSLLPFCPGSAAGSTRFERESFGALHQVLANLEAEQVDTWNEIERELRQFEGPEGFEPPCEMIVGAGVKEKLTAQCAGNWPAPSPAAW
ncbi:MAG: hypothetical protein M3Q71_05905 [Chloroflexota bacterium]|nr:hypothetical protein [Chloroflexota bacterium]